MTIFGVELDPRAATGLALVMGGIVVWILSHGTGGLLSGVTRVTRRWLYRTKSVMPSTSPYKGGSDEPAPAGSEKYINGIIVSLRDVGAQDEEIIDALSDTQTLHEAVMNVCAKKKQEDQE